MTGNVEGIVQLEEGQRWVELREPFRVIEAWSAAEITSLLREVEALNRSRRCFVLGYLCYEAGTAFGLTVTPRNASLPLAWFAAFDEAAVQIVERPKASEPYTLGPLRPSVEPADFRKTAGQILRHIADGDTYQVNYTFKLRGAFGGDPRALFADLAATQRGRYSAFIRAGDWAICSASPELFFTLHVPTHPGDASAAAARSRITARPMKGTARRGRTLAEDGERSSRLVESAKERAENVMVVDMVRNDLGRVAEFGSVEVPELFTLEKYPNVWQMTSTVTGETGKPLDAILAATFPSASVTGAPKVRTMEIIAALEGEPRGVYTGAIGLITPDGSAQFNVAIRTAVVDRREGTVEFGVGSGVVWDSDPDREYEECLLKGSVLGRRPVAFELLETMRWTPGEGWFLLERHLGRLHASAQYFGFMCPLDAVRAELARAVHGADRPLRVRLRLAEDGGIHVEHAPLAQSPAIWRVQLAASPIDPSDPFLFHKTTNRGVYEAAFVPGCDDVVLWNPKRQVTESTVANVVVEIGGRRLTPPVACGLLAGTFRAELLATGQAVEGVVTIDELRRAERMWLVNSVRGWCPATCVGQP